MGEPEARWHAVAGYRDGEHIAMHLESSCSPAWCGQDPVQPVIIPEPDSDVAPPFQVNVVRITPGRVWVTTMDRRSAGLVLRIDEWRELAARIKAGEFDSL